MVRCHYRRLHLWVVIGIVLGAVIVLFIFIILLCITALRRNAVTGKCREITPVVSKEIQAIIKAPAADQRQSLPEHRMVISVQGTSSGGESMAADSGHLGGSLPEVSHLGWGKWYTLIELETASNGLSDGNVIGEGGYDIVYYGVLADNTPVAIKNLLNNRGEAEKEFKVEVEAIGRVRHKNLVRLFGYCVEGTYRMLVYEYVDNGRVKPDKK